MNRLPVLLLSAAAVLAGCATESEKPVVGRVSALPAVQHPADNPGTPAKVALGKHLFVDARLSGSGKTACQSCHYRHLGWTDGKELSARDDGKLNTRHTPSLYNVGYQSLWYWDGRATTLEAQITAAWRGQSGADPAKVAELLNGVPGYRSQFEAAFGGPATPANIAQALGAYLRTKNSENSPWDRYEGGDVKAVSRDAVEGYLLFTGKGRCSTCHAAPFYGNSTFFNIGLEHGKATPDIGRLNVTKAEADRGAFKTPSLRSAALSAPYFHDGSVKTLREAVAYMAGGGKPDPANTPLMQPTGMTPQEIDKVVAFITSLTSEEPWQAPTLP
jgi:cytochrome c peroxidase